MRICHRFLFTAAGIAVLSSLALGEATGEKAAPPKTKGSLLNRLGAGDMAAAAADLHKAAQAFERFANTLKAITPSITRALLQGSRNLASMGHAFDPLGLKMALTIIREQNQIIYALQKAEIQRLKQECQRLQKTPAPRPAKTKKRKKGRR